MRPEIPKPAEIGVPEMPTAPSMPPRMAAELKIGSRVMGREKTFAIWTLGEPRTWRMDVAKPLAFQPMMSSVKPVATAPRSAVPEATPSMKMAVAMPTVEIGETIRNAKSVESTMPMSTGSSVVAALSGGPGAGTVARGAEE